jgi:hypothetical protein
LNSELPGLDRLLKHKHRLKKLWHETRDHWQLSKAHTGPRFACGFQIPYFYDFITKLCRQQAEVIQNHHYTNVRNIGQGEAQHWKYKRLKLGGGQAYDCSND